MRSVRTFVAACLMVTAATVRVAASPIDIASITCGEMAEWSAEERYDVFVFFLGYYGGTTKSAKFDDEVIEPYAIKFEKWCLANPKSRILDNVRTIFETP